jgi:hypothetical protein
MHRSSGQSKKGITAFPPEIGALLSPVRSGSDSWLTPSGARPVEVSNSFGTMSDLLRSQRVI